MKELNIITIGFIFVLMGFLIIFIGSLLAAMQAPTNGKSNLKVSFFGLLGPIPFGFSNDKRLFVFTVIITLVVVILIIFMRSAKWS